MDILTQEAYGWWYKLSPSNKQAILKEYWDYLVNNNKPTALFIGDTGLKELKKGSHYTSVTNEWYYAPARYTAKTIN